MRRLLLAGVIAIVAQSAYAQEPADLPILRGGFREPAPVPAYQTVWQGIYAGGHYGFSSHDFDFSSTTVGIQQYLVRESLFAESVGKWQLLGSSNQRASGFGGFIGYNAQYENVVIGVEGNYTHFNGKWGGSHASLSRVISNPDGSNPPAGHTYEYLVTLTGDARARVNDVATLRARGGYTMGSFMPYVFAGLAAGFVDIDRSATVSITTTDIWTDSAAIPHRDSLNTTVASKSESQKNLLTFGFTGGLGFEYMLWSNIFVRAEWEYTALTTAKDTFIQINTGRAGVGYKF